MKARNGNQRNKGGRSTPSRQPGTPQQQEGLIKLFEEELKDIYWAEKHLTKVLPKMAKAASSEELSRAFQEHLSQTQNQISRLEQVFSASGLKVAAKTCEGMEGLTKEGDEKIEEHEKGSIRDAGLIISAQKVEHYEIAAYGSLRAMAQLLTLDDAAELLQETLDEEGETDKKLTQLAETINHEAMNEAEEED
jgi:ferritin-like metal-binding protein YciE